MAVEIFIYSVQHLLRGVGQDYHPSATIFSGAVLRETVPART